MSRMVEINMIFVFVLTFGICGISRTLLAEEIPQQDGSEMPGSKDDLSIGPRKLSKRDIAKRSSGLLKVFRVLNLP